MKPWDVLEIALSTFINNKMRTLLTVFGISIGISAIVFLVSLGYGLQKITIGEINSIKALSTYNVTTGNSSILKLNTEAIDDLKSIQNVDSVNPTVSLSGQVQIDSVKTDAVINLASAEFLGLESPQVEQGSLFTDDREETIVISSLIAKALNISPGDLIEKKLMLTYASPTGKEGEPDRTEEKTYKVRGVIKDMNAAYLYAPIGTVQLPDSINYSSAKVRVHASSNMETVKASLIERGYKASSIGERINEINKVFSIGKIILFILGAIALLVGSIGMFNTLTISLLERTRDIGIMKSIGATDQGVYAIFLAESTLISFMGAVVGIGSSLLIGGVINITLSTLAVRAGGQPLALFDPPLLFLLAIFFLSVITGFLTGIYPARRAAKLNPLDALRYE